MMIIGCDFHPSWQQIAWLARLGKPGNGFCPVDFHAVCGDIDIPWATKEGRDCYQRTQALTAQKTG